MITNKSNLLARQYFEESEITGCNSQVPNSVVIKDGIITGNKGLLLDGILIGCHISTSDNSPIIVSARAELKECVIEGGDVLIDGKFSGTLAIRGKDNEDVGGRLEFGAGSQIRGVSYVAENIVQAKGIKVVMDMSQKPYGQFKTETAHINQPQQIETHVVHAAA